GGEWNRQTLWRQRLEAYTQLLRVSTDYLDRCCLLRSEINSDSLGASDHTVSSSELSHLRAETFKALTVVEIFCDDQILSALKKYVRRVQNPEENSNALRVDAISKEIDALLGLQAEFVIAARAQLKSSLDEA